MLFYFRYFILTNINRLLKEEFEEEV